MEKAKIRRLLSLSKNKYILKLVLKYKSDEITNEIINILNKLSLSNRTENQKCELILMYINNRDKDHIIDLICNNMILKTYSFERQIEIINHYINDNRSYKNIIKKCYIMNKKGKTISHIRKDK